MSLRKFVLLGCIAACAPAIASQITIGDTQISGSADITGDIEVEAKSDTSIEGEIQDYATEWDGYYLAAYSGDEYGNFEVSTFVNKYDSSDVTAEAIFEYSTTVTNDTASTQDIDLTFTIDDGSMGVFYSEPEFSNFDLSEIVQTALADSTYSELTADISVIDEDNNVTSVWSLSLLVDSTGSYVASSDGLFDFNYTTEDLLNAEEQGNGSEDLFYENYPVEYDSSDVVYALTWDEETYTAYLGSLASSESLTVVYSVTATTSSDNSWGGWVDFSDPFEFSSADNSNFVFTVSNSASVPEPASLGLMALGLFGLVASRKRKAA